MATSKKNFGLSEKKIAENAYDAMLENFLPLVQKAAKAATHLADCENAYEDLLLKGYYGLKEAMNTNPCDSKRFNKICLNSIKEGILGQLAVGSAL